MVKQHLRLRADSMPCDQMPSTQVVAITRMAHLVRRYDAKEMWASEMLYHVLGTFMALTGPDRTAVWEYFRKCGNWKPVQSHMKGPEDATRSLSEKENPKRANESGGEKSR